jgi:hypothetical protein
MEYDTTHRPVAWYDRPAETAGGGEPDGLVNYLVAQDRPLLVCEAAM